MSTKCTCYLGGEEVPPGTNGGGRGGAHAPVMSTKCSCYLGGEEVPPDTNDGGGGGAHAPVMSTKCSCYLGVDLVLYDTCHMGRAQHVTFSLGRSYRIIQKQNECHNETKKNWKF